MCAFLSSEVGESFIKSFGEAQNDKIRLPAKSMDSQTKNAAGVKGDAYGTTKTAARQLMVAVSAECAA